MTRKLLKAFFKALRNLCLPHQATRKAIPEETKEERSRLGGETRGRRHYIIKIFIAVQQQQENLGS